MRRAGARTIDQDQGSSLIDGMPRLAFEAWALELQLPLGRIAAKIPPRRRAGRISPTFARHQPYMRADVGNV
jgi:chemotaxis response regulator CheB